MSFPSIYFSWGLFDRIGDSCRGHVFQQLLEREFPLLKGKEARKVFLVHVLTLDSRDFRFNPRPPNTVPNGIVGK